MISADALVEAIYRAQSAGVPESGTAVTLLGDRGVTVLTLRECREHLAVALCKEPRA